MATDYDCWRSRFSDARLHRFAFDFFDSHFFAPVFAVVSQCPKFDLQTVMRNRINYSLDVHVRSLHTCPIKANFVAFTLAAKWRFILFSFFVDQFA